jgi:hypothetical protein
MGIERSSAWQYLPTLIADGILSLRQEPDRKSSRPRKSLNRHFYLRRPTTGTLIDLLNAGPPYLLDFWMHISCQLKLSQAFSLSQLVSYL